MVGTWIRPTTQCSNKEIGQHLRSGGTGTLYGVVFRVPTFGDRAFGQEVVGVTFQQSKALAWNVIMSVFSCPYAAAYSGRHLGCIMRFPKLFFLVMPVVTGIE